MNRKKILGLMLLIVSLNVKAAKLVFTSEKTPTYSKTDEKFIKYVKYKNQAVESEDMIGVTDGTLDFENLEMFAGYVKKPKLWGYNEWENNSYAKSSDYSGGHLVEVYRAFALGAGEVGKYQDNIYSTVFVTESAVLPKGIFSSSYTIKDSYRHYLGENAIYFGNILNEIAVGDVASPRFYTDGKTENNNLIFHSMGNPTNVNEKDWIVKNFGKTLINTVEPTFETMHFGMFGEEVQKLMRAEKVRVGQYACSDTQNKDTVKDISGLVTNSIKNGIKTDTTRGIGKTLRENSFQEKNKNISCVFPAGKMDTTVYPLYSRANAVYENGQVIRFQEGNKLEMEDGSVIRDWAIVSGTSYAAPRLAGGAKQVSELFPGITYHQLKQFIFTTASREKDSLDNVLGWGIADIEKAKKGLSAINAGLVEEQKFFTGMYDRIKSKDGRTFFWAEIPEGKEWNWHNDIKGSMIEKPQGESCYNMLVDTIDEKTGYTNVATKKYAVIENMCVQNFIPSEKNFYRNDKDIETLAGLRKAGNGTLNIYGKLEIDGNLQVLQGELRIFNDVDTQVEVYEGARLFVNYDTNLKNLNKDKKVNIKKVVALGGKIVFGGNVNVEEMYFGDENIRNIEIKGNVAVERMVVKNQKEIEKWKNFMEKSKMFVIKSFEIDNQIYENIVINPDKTMDIPREYFMSNFGNKITGYSADSKIYDKLVQKYGEMANMHENIKKIVPGYSKGEFRLDMDIDADSFNKEDFVNGSGNYVKSARGALETMEEKYYFMEQN